MVFHQSREPRDGLTKGSSGRRSPWCHRTIRFFLIVYTGFAPPLSLDVSMSVFSGTCEFVASWKACGASPHAGSLQKSVGLSCLPCVLGPAQLVLFLLGCSCFRQSGVCLHHRLRGAGRKLWLRGSSKLVVFSLRFPRLQHESCFRRVWPCFDTVSGLWCRESPNAGRAALVRSIGERGPRAPSARSTSILGIWPWTCRVSYVSRLGCMWAHEVSSRQSQTKKHLEASRVFFELFKASPSVRLRESSNLLTSAWSGPATTCSSNICRTGRLLIGSSAGRSGWR